MWPQELNEGIKYLKERVNTEFYTEHSVGRLEKRIIYYETASEVKSIVELVQCSPVIKQSSPLAVLCYTVSNSTTPAEKYELRDSLPSLKEFNQYYHNQYTFIGNTMTGGKDHRER